MNIFAEFKLKKEHFSELKAVFPDSAQYPCQCVFEI